MVAETAQEAKALATDLKIAEQALSERRAVFEEQLHSKKIAPIEYPEMYWRIVGIHDSIKIFRRFCESDIVSLDSLLLAQKARYFFEVALWVRALATPSYNAKLYYEYLLHKKRDSYQELILYFDTEIHQLELTQKAFELHLQKRAIADASLGRPFSTATVKETIKEFDDYSNHRFSIFRRFSSGNYAFYASHIRSSSLTSYKSDLEQTKQEIADLEALINRKIALPPKTAHFAKSVGMQAEYNFIFKLTSKLLHATPLSISTDMQEISEQENLIFVEYIRAKGREALAHSLYLMCDYKRAPRIAGLGRNFSATRRSASRKKFNGEPKAAAI